MIKIDEERTILTGKIIELSEAEDKSYLELINRVCYYDEPNLNGVILPSENALEKAQTLIHQPIVAKYTVDSNGKPNFRGHEMYIDSSDGEMCFGTEQIGTNTEVYIENDNVTVNNTTKNLPCLFSKIRIPKRNKNIISTIKRLHEEVGSLGNSWELSTKSYTYENNIKTITDYEFLGVCLLGSDVLAAYGKDSKTISVSSKSELMIAEALVKDINENNMESERNNIESSNGKEDEQLKKKVPNATDNTNNENNDNAEINNIDNNADNKKSIEDNTSQENKTQTSALTHRDLRNKLEEALQEEFGYVEIEFYFPLENKAWFKTYNYHNNYNNNGDDNSLNDLDFMQVMYEVENDEIVNISEPEKITLSASISELMKVGGKMEDLEKNIAEKDDLLVKTSTMIASLNETIETLKPFKESFDKIQAEKLEAEKLEKQTNMIKKAINTKLFISEEFENNEELKAIVSEVDETKLNSMIVERLAKSLEAQTSTTETSEVKNKEEKVTSNLNIDDEIVTNKASAFFKAVMSKK